MNKRNTLAGRVGLLAVALFAVGCEESVTPARPRFWVGEPPAQLVFAGQPNNAAVAPGCAAASGTAISVDVTVVDATGKVITDFTGLVKLTIENDASAGANATLCGNTEVDVVDGVARFSGLGVDQPGEGYTLVAIAEGAESAVSAPFDITTETAETAPTGDLTVETVTTGSSSGYTVTVVGGGSQAIEATGSVTFKGLAPGSHRVTLEGVPRTCTVTGENPRDVDVPSGGYANTKFEISCGTPSSSLMVSNTTTGSGFPTSYTVTVDAGTPGQVSQTMVPNGNTTFIGLSAGRHSVALAVASNCTVTSTNPLTAVNVPSGGQGTASFTVNCITPSGSLMVSNSTTGSSFPTSYTVTVDAGLPGERSMTMAPNGSVTFTSVPAGSHSVRLTVAANCTVTSTNPLPAVNVPSGGQGTASFSVNCITPSGSLMVSNSTTGSGFPSSYTVTVDPGPGQRSQTMVPNGSTTFTGLSAGSHTVALAVASNCTVTSTNPLTGVNVPSGGTGTASFTVTCALPRLVFTGQPNDAVANVNLVGQCVFAPSDPSLPTTVSAAVTATQNGGTPVASVSVSITVVHVSGTTGTVCPGSTMTAVTGSDGVAHFNLSIGQGLTDPPGTYSLTATATVQGMTLTVSSNTFTVSVIT
jgi:hypothetical protein